jgi:gamma-glutamylcyclotransferase (GGCT)/AIG2-like uncharacterized protein YtfP
VAEGETPNPVFVYGTLRPGADNAAVLDPFVVRTAPGRLLAHRLHLLEYPCIVSSPFAADAVIGDIVWVDPTRNTDALARLDHFEGYDRTDESTSLYVRVERDVVTDDGAAVRCWVYLAGHSLEERVDTKSAIASGDFLRRA